MSKQKRNNANHQPYKILDNDTITKIDNTLFNTMATNPELRDSIKPYTYQLIFTYYNHNECQLHKLDEQLCRKLITRFNEVTKLDYHNIKEWTRHSIEKESDNYKDLFNTLPQDIEKIYNKEIGSAARIFYYLIANYFCIITVKFDHP